MDTLMKLSINKKSKESKYFEEIDLGHYGGKFTLDKRQGCQASIKKRLDKAIADRSWIESNLLNIVEHFMFE